MEVLMHLWQEASASDLMISLVFSFQLPLAMFRSHRTASAAQLASTFQLSPKTPLGVFFFIAARNHGS
jgi:hypothetical protein